jgi:hypothetical protein
MHLKLATFLYWHIYFLKKHKNIVSLWLESGKFSCSPFLLAWIGFYFLFPCQGWVSNFLEACLHNTTDSLPYTLWPRRWQQYIPPKCWYPPTRLCSVKTQSTTFQTLTAMFSVCNTAMWPFDNRALLKCT